jgi:hypothetical protein
VKKLLLTVTFTATLASLAAAQQEGRAARPKGPSLLRSC